VLVNRHFCCVGDIRVMTEALAPGSPNVLRSATNPRKPIKEMRGGEGKRGTLLTAYPHREKQRSKICP
jgi:hypothetical protein